MKQILLSGEKWKSANDFYKAFFRAIGAPKWHGRNLDALNDSIGTGSINKIEIPYTIRITGLASMSPKARKFIDSFRELIDDLKAEGIEVDLICED